MIYNFGYTSLDKHDFERQNQFHNALGNDNRLDEDTRKFIGFLAGTHFFDDNTRTIEEWFNSSYWTAAKDIEDYKLPYTINDVLDLPYGLNYSKMFCLD